MMRARVLRGVVVGLALVLPAPPAAAQSDPTFVLPRGFDCTYSHNRSIDALAPALDGSGDVYVAGRFTTYDEHRQSALLRLNADGSLDPGFAPAGSGFNASVFALATATDGSGDLYAAGAFTSYDGTPCNRIVRLNADGTVDPAFVVGSGFNSSVWAVAVATDGSGDVYAGGDFTSYKGVSSKGIIRLNADGSIDGSFAVGTGFNYQVLALAPQSDGDVYVGGAFTTYKGVSGVHRLVRLNADGSVDSAFATGTGFNLNSVSAVVVDAWGDVYAGGSFWQYQGVAAERIIRLNADGSRDPGFDIGGGGANGPVESLALANDGSGDVFIGGQFGSYRGQPGTMRMARVNPDGSVDTSFALGTGFTGGLGGDITIRAIAVTTDGSGDVLAGGYFTIFDGTAVDHLVRVNADGTLDPSTRLGAGFNDAVNAIAPAVDGSGDVYAGGRFGFYAGTVCNRLVRLDADGRVDPAFVTGSGFNQQVMALATAVDGSGDLYVGGAYQVYRGAACPAIVRLDADGARDLAFDPSTTVLNGSVNGLALAADGSGDIFAAGTFTGRVVRLSATGALVNAATGTGFNGAVNAIAVAPDGDLIAVGQFSSYAGVSSAGVIRLNPDLTIDSVAAGTGLNGTAYSVAVSGSSIYVGGGFTKYNGTTRMRICRLTATLALDLGFDPGAGFSYPANTTLVQCLLVTSSGRLYAGGRFQSYGGASSPMLVAIHPDGTRDTGFSVGTGLTNGALALAEALDGSGDLYVGGSFRSYRNFTADGVVALDPDGSVD